MYASLKVNKTLIIKKFFFFLSFFYLNPLDLKKKILKKNIKKNYL